MRSYQTPQSYWSKFVITVQWFTVPDTVPKHLKSIYDLDYVQLHTASTNFYYLRAFKFPHLYCVSYLKHLLNPPPSFPAADAKVEALVGLFLAFSAFEEAGRTAEVATKRRRLVVDPTPLRLALAVSEAGFNVGASQPSLNLTPLLPLDICFPTTPA